MSEKKKTGSSIAYEHTREFKAACKELEAQLRAELASGKWTPRPIPTDDLLREWVRKSVKHRHEEAKRK